VSDYGYDAYGNPLSGPQEPAPAQEPKWFRERMDKVSEQVKALQEENENLRRQRSQAQIREQFTAKGYAPEAASLYQGEPDKLDEWLGTHGAALAKTTPSGDGSQAQPQVPPGPPASTVPADQQVQMQQMAQAGTQGVLPPQGTDKELAAQIAAAQTPEEFERIMRSQGNRLDWT
jgi:hypothetical protein